MLWDEPAFHDSPPFGDTIATLGAMPSTIAKFAALTDAYGAAGFDVESQVRYHPPAGREGDIDAWEEYVRAVVRTLGRRPALTALSNLTTEVFIFVSAMIGGGLFAKIVFPAGSGA